MFALIYLIFIFSSQYKFIQRGNVKYSLIFLLFNFSFKDLIYVLISIGCSYIKFFKIYANSFNAVSFSSPNQALI